MSAGVQITLIICLTIVSVIYIAIKYEDNNDDKDKKREEEEHGK